MVLTQSAAIGHFHGGCQSTGNHLRPHFHKSTDMHSHGHSHGFNHHHHHGNEVVPFESSVQNIPVQDHDSDAVFVDANDIVISQRVLLDVKSSDINLLIFPWLNGSIANFENGTFQKMNWDQIPPPFNDSSPLYIRHLTLLI
jgi:hypothetical protein